MEVRIQEGVMWFIPGSYFMVLLCSVLFLFGDKGEALVNNWIETHKRIYGFMNSDSGTALIVFVFPIVCIVVGYVLNWMASALEWGIYKCNCFPRPSRKILNGKTRRCAIDNLNSLKSKLGLSVVLGNGSKINNADAYKCYKKARQIVSEEYIEKYFFKFILGRNLLMAQLLMTLLSILVSCSIWFKVGMGIWFVMLIGTYYRQNLVHTRCVFISFLSKCDSV